MTNLSEMEPTRPTEEMVAAFKAAWERLTRLKRDREREKKLGYIMRGGTYDEYNSRAQKDCPHTPKWGIAG
jgi:hypothetical protein